MGLLDERKRRFSLAPVDPDIESLSPSECEPTLRKSIAENTKYALVYACLLLAVLGVFAAIGVAVWLLVREVKGKAAEKEKEKERVAVEGAVEGAVGEVVERLVRRVLG